MSTKGLTGNLKRAAVSAVSGTVNAVRRVRGARASPANEAGASYWTRHNVTLHRAFDDAAESLEYFWWRNDQYPGYIELMPVAGHDGKSILDYGCGPGNDLVGFTVYSRPSRLIGMDVSPTSIAQAGARVRLHGPEPELALIREEVKRLPLDSASIDYIHCSGVLHHVPDPLAVLREFRRVLKPGGEVRLMVYNYESVWLHLRAAYLLRVATRTYAHLSVQDAFAQSTDGPDCPIARVYTPTEFCSLGEQAGFSPTYLGAAISLTELEDLRQRRWEAVMSPRLAREHRLFLSELEFDARGLPRRGSIVAGVDACFSFRVG